MFLPPKRNAEAFLYSISFRPVFLFIPRGVADDFPVKERTSSSEFFRIFAAKRKAIFWMKCNDKHFAFAPKRYRASVVIEIRHLSSGDNR